MYLLVQLQSNTVLFFILINESSLPVFPTVQNVLKCQINMSNYLTVRQQKEPKSLIICTYSAAPNSQLSKTVYIYSCTVNVIYIRLVYSYVNISLIQSFDPTCID